MQTKLDEAKAELLARAARVAENSPAGGHLPTGTERARDAVRTRTPCSRSSSATTCTPPPRTSPTATRSTSSEPPLSHYRLAENRPQGTANVRVHTPTVEENGWTCSHSVVEVVTDDMPFLVDSVTNELSRQGRGIHVVIHPQVVVRRDVTGKLIEVLGPDCDAHGARERAAARRARRVLDPRRDRPRDRPRRPQADHRRPAARPVRRPRGRRGLGEDARRRAAHRRRAARRADRRRPARRRRSRRPASCCAGSPTTTSPSSATASTSSRDGDSLAAVPGTGLGILRSDPHHSERRRTTRSARPSTGCPPTPAPRPASTSCWS